MKIYTKKGDKGSTQLIGGTRVSKAHVRIEAYGSVDELNAQLGLLRDLLPEEPLRQFLLEIQKHLFVIGSQLAADPGKSKMKLPELNQAHIKGLEAEIDKMEGGLPSMTHFILPGGHPTVSACHIARCVCRRSERQVIALNDLAPVDTLLLAYLNRLSDYLFVLARKIGQNLGVQEILWLP